MKKRYFSPSVKVVNVKSEGMLCDSRIENGGNDNGNGTMSSKEDNDEGLW